MLRTLILIASVALLIAPEASAQSSSKAQASAKLIGDLTVQALRAHMSDRMDLPEVRNMIRRANYARVQRIRSRVRESTLTLDESLRRLMENGAISADDAQLFRRLAEQDDPEGAKRIGTLMVKSENLIVGATGSIVLQMVNNPEDAAGEVQAQSGNTGAQIGAGLDNIDWGDVAGDAAKGSLIGGMIGGGVGAAIGAAIGGLASAVADFLNGFLGGGGGEGGEEGGDGGDGGSAFGDGMPAPMPAPAPEPAPTP